MLDILIENEYDDKLVNEISSDNPFMVKSAITKLPMLEDYDGGSIIVKELFERFEQIFIKNELIKRIPTDSMILVDLLLHTEIEIVPMGIKQKIWSIMDSSLLTRVIMIMGKDHPMSNKARRIIAEQSIVVAEIVESEDDNLTPKKQMSSKKKRII